jgi:hypothetical protein
LSYWPSYAADDVDENGCDVEQRETRYLCFNIRLLIVLKEWKGKEKVPRQVLPARRCLFNEEQRPVRLVVDPSLVTRLHFWGDPFLFSSSSP